MTPPGAWTARVRISGMFPDNLTRAEVRHRAGLLDTSAYAIEIDLSGRTVADPATQFASTTTLTFTARSAGQTHVDLIADHVARARLDGTDVDPAGFTGARLPLTLAAGPHQLTVTAVCPYSRSGEGLHRFLDPADGRTYLYTQFESANARRMYACFEQPDLKARFTLTVTAPETWTVVGNTSVAGTAEAGPGLRRTRFAETPPISTYLTVLIAGDYARVAGPPLGRGRVPSALYCRQSVTPHLDAEEILDITAGGLAVFEQHFGVDYPFDKYDQVFVPEYNGGAMENVGCVTLRDEYLFRSKVTAASLDNRRNTILHELSHMWFGDLVTMRWWDDLWLKESFATWSASFAVSEQSDDPDASWAAFASTQKTSAYRQDQLPSTHPVAADIVDLDAVELNFDMITYAKGAALVAQLVSYVGREAFLAGVRDYFATHAFGNTALADLLVSLQRASGRDLSRWSAAWLETAGVNTLRLQLDTDEAGVVTDAALIQTAPEQHPTLREHRLALGLYAERDGGLVRTSRLEQDVAGPRTPVPGLVGRPRPAAIVVNDDDLTYAKIRLDPESLAAVVAGLPTVGSPLTRAVLWGGMWDICRDAELPAADYVDVVLRGLLAEPDPTVVRNLLAQAGTAAYTYAPPSGQAKLAETWTRGLAGLLTGAPAGSDLQLNLARAFVLAANPGWSGELLHRWWSGAEVPEGLVLDADLRWLVLANLSRLGLIGEHEIAAEQERDPSVAGAEQAAGARTAQPTAAAKARAWWLAVETDDITNTVNHAICQSFWLRGQDELLLPYVDRYFAAAEDISALRGVWADKGAALRKNVLRWLFPWPLDKQAFLDRLDLWLAGAPVSDAARRIIGERRDDLVRALRCQTGG